MLPADLLEGPMCWVDVRGLGDERTLRAVGERFDLHPLALEDAVNAPQRAKMELYENHQLLIARIRWWGKDAFSRSPRSAS